MLHQFGIGDWLVNSYYHLSPVVAEQIATRSVLQRAVWLGFVLFLEGGFAFGMAGENTLF